MGLQLIDRFQPEMRGLQQEAIDEGRLEKRLEVDLLDEKTLRPLALLSLLLLIIGAIGFIGLNLLTYYWQYRTLTFIVWNWGLVWWLVGNLIGGIVVLPLHEAIHGLAFKFWGGRPYYGAKLPFALYCGARGQLFRRNQYLVVGLAPLVILTGAAVVFTIISPVLASYTLFASVSNFSGAAGDLWAAVALLRQKSDVLVADTDTGFSTWEIVPANTVESTG